MQTGYFVVKGSNCFNAVSEFIRDDYKVEYEKKLLDGVLFGAEDYSQLSNNNLLIIITVEKMNGSDNECELEIIAGGGASGILGVTFGNEERRVKKFYNRMVDFCEPLNYSISELEEQ